MQQQEVCAISNRRLSCRSTLGLGLRFTLYGLLCVHVLSLTIHPCSWISAIGVDHLRCCDEGCPCPKIILDGESLLAEHYAQYVMLVLSRVPKETGLG